MKKITTVLLGLSLLIAAANTNAAVVQAVCNLKPVSMMPQWIKSRTKMPVYYYTAGTATGLIVKSFRDPNTGKYVVEEMTNEQATADKLLVETNWQSLDGKATILNAAHNAGILACLASK